MYFYACSKITCDDYNVSRSHCLPPNHTQLMGNLLQPMAYERLDQEVQFLGTKKSAGIPAGLNMFPNYPSLGMDSK